MKKTKYDSFLEFLQYNYTEQIADILLDYFKDKLLYATQEEYNDPQTYEFKISTKVKLTKVSLYKSAEYGIDFDVVAKALTEVSDLVGGELQTNYMEDYFVLSIKGVLYNGLRNLDVYSIKKSKSCRPYEDGDMLNDLAVAYISKEQFEDYANEFLLRYFPEALRHPTRIDVIKILRKMNLRVMFGPLPDGCYGKTIFGNEVIQVYNFKDDVVEDFHAKPGTIVIDLGTAHQHGGTGFLNATAIHECLHWYLHRSYFEMQKLLNSNVTSLESCFGEGTKEPEDKKVRTKYFIEYQANNISYHILMPSKQATLKFNEIVSSVRKRTHLKKKALYEKAVSEFANFFGTTLYSAKIRLKELGFTQLECISDDYSTKFFRSRTYRPNSNETYIVDSNQAYLLLKKDKILRNLVGTQAVVYVDKMFVINNPLYVKTYKNKVGYRLTGRALNDVSKCCLLFDTKTVSISVRYNPEVFNMMTFYSGGYTSENSRSVTLDQNKQRNKVVLQKIKDNLGNIDTNEYKRNKEIVNSLKMFNTFSNKFNFLLSLSEYQKYSNRLIGKRSYLSEGTIRRMRNGETAPSLKQMYALIAGMEIAPIIAAHFINFLGGSYDLNSENEGFSLYTYLSISSYKMGIEYWNKTIRDSMEDSSAFVFP